MKKEFVSIFIFGLAFLVLAFFVKNLFFYVDDFSYGLGGPPYLIKDFFGFSKDYIAYHGLFRPLALVYYFFIYSLYTHSSALAHLAPYLLQTISGYLLFQVLRKQGLNQSFALLLGLLFILHPFATEQYMWLSANPGTIANLIFILQLWFIETVQGKKTATIIVVLLSIISVLTYESTFFMFIPLSYLLYKKYYVHEKSNTNFIKLLLFNSVSLAVYLLTKLLVKGQNPRAFIDSFSLLIDHIKGLFSNLYITHFSAYYLHNFWLGYLQNGWGILMNTSWNVILIFLFFMISIVLFFSAQTDILVRFKKEKMFFWFMVFVFSVLPLLVNKEFLFPYRSLFLPTIVLIIIIGFLVQQSTNIFIFYIYKIICFVAIIFFVFINISITQKYISQYDQDMLLAQKINTILIRQGLEGQNSYIVLKSEVPMDSRNTFVRTDHILSCYFQEWSALPCFTSINKNVKAIAIIHSDGRFVLQRNENYNNLLRKKPLIFLRYTQDKTVSVDRLIL